MQIKELFEKAEGGTLTFEQFEALVKENKVKFEDISEGKYVSKHKYDDDMKAKEDQISTLNATITSRDTDLESLKSKLAEAGTDATKLTQLQEQFGQLQSQYDTDTKKYQQQLEDQAYNFAVREYANGQKFSSSAAKRDFTSQLIAAKLKMDKGNILGADDFKNAYAQENADAFVVEDPNAGQPPKQQPTITLPTGGGNPTPKKYTLSEMMKMKNENPDLVITIGE